MKLNVRPMRIKLVVFVVLSTLVGYGQEFAATDLKIPSEKITVNGTLLAPSNGTDVPLVIIIPGSGSVDRDGNAGPMKMEILKQLATDLATRQIATFRYDKSVLAASKIKGFNEADMNFDDFVVDAKAVVRYFSKEKKFSKLIIAGHSQGSLVGMLAAEDGAVDAFISIAGAGRTIDQIMTDQVMAQSPMFKEDLAKTFAIIAEGKVDENFNPLLASIFRTSVQPFMGSWMKYDPSVELKKLSIPVLLINGTKDVQVSVQEAELLHKAKPTATLRLLKDMNHAFKEVTTDDRAKNLGSYTDLTLPIMPILINEIEEFVDGLK